jgi:hypothetical protein
VAAKTVLVTVTIAEEVLPLIPGGTFRPGDFYPPAGRAMLTSKTHQADGDKLVFATIRPRWYAAW